MFAHALSGLLHCMYFATLSKGDSRLSTVQGVLPVVTPLNNAVKQLSASTQLHHLPGASRLVSQGAVGSKWKQTSCCAAAEQV